MKTVFKKITAVATAVILLAVCIVFDFPEKLVVSAAGAHTHKVCVNAENCPNCAHSDITWTPWTKDNELPTSGNYYLTQNVTVTAETVIAENTELSLCLNGCTVTMDSSAAGKSIYKVKGTLNLSDCKNTGKLTGVSYLERTGNAPVYISYVEDSNAGRFNMYSGTISDNSADNAGGVYVNEEAVFNMYGGKISNNTHQYEHSGGGGVSIYAGTFTMFGGTISGNTALKGGGGVYSYYGTFIMNGGTITKNGGMNPDDCPTYGGGVYVSRGGTFTMNSGNISSNKAESTGGGVYSEGTFEMYNGATISSNESITDCGGGVGSLGTFIMHGGEISDNTAMSGGGGVYNTDKFEMSGGTISGNSPMMDNGGGVYNSGTFTINGTVNITSNSRDNVYLSGSKIITIGSSFNTDSSVGVTTSKTPTCAAPITITGSTSADISSSFSSDNTDYEIAYADGVLKLTKHTYSDSYSQDESKHWYECTICHEHKDEAAHTWADNGKTDPTVTAAGSKSSKCSVCQHIKSEEIPILTNETVWKKTVDKYPTTSSDGTYKYTSTTYGEVTVTVPALTDSTWTKTQHEDPTEESEGKDVYTSTLYGEVTVVLDKLAHTHDWGSWTLTANPTITATGTAERVCSKDNTHKGTKTDVPALSDSGTWEKADSSAEPTVDNNGSYTYESTDYGTVTITVPKLTDTTVWGKTEFAPKPTLSADGKYKFTSDIYGEVTVTVPKLTDTTVWRKTEFDPKPTISADGTYEFTNTVYGDVSVTVPKLTDGIWTKNIESEPTVDNTGSYKYTSTDYGAVTVTVPKLTESPWAKTIISEPALETTGTYKYTSGYGEVTVTVPKLTDDTVWTKDSNKSVEPTEEKPGKYVYTSKYGEVVVEIPKKEHTHTFSTDWSKNADYHWHAATCEHTSEVSDKATHTWDGGVVTTPATETTEGVKTYTCTTCGQTKTEPIAKLDHTHIPSDKWTSDASGHWHSCSGCAEKLEFSAHTEDSGTVTVQPTETTEGTKTFKCTVCGYVMRTETIPATGTVHVHDFGTAWKYDTANHWHECSCGEKKDSAAHTWNSGEITKRPTASTKGEKTFECTVCGKTRTETIPATGGSGGSDRPSRPSHPQPDNGSITEEIQPGENAPGTKITTPLDELADIVLTPAEKAEVNDGTDIIIILTIEDGTYLVPASDKTKVETVIGGMQDYKLGQYLDVNLLKIIGGVQEKITETNAPITVMFEIPEALRDEGREYAVIRVHDGETAILPDLDNDEKTVTIRTDKFSTYALAYSEKTDSNTSDESSEPTTDSSDPISEGSEPADSGETSSGSGEGSSDSSTTSPSGESSSTGENSGESGTSPSTDENNSVPSESTPSGSTENPATGIAVSLIPLTLALAAMTAVTVKRKKK